MQAQPLVREDPLKKEMATYSSVLGKSHGQLQPARLLCPWGRKRVRQDLVTKQQQQNYRLMFPSFISAD